MKTEQKIKRLSFIIDNRPDWQARGEVFKALREVENLTVNYVSKQLGISPARLKRFENGDPILDSKLIESAYNHYLHVNSLKNRGYCDGKKCRK